MAAGPGGQTDADTNPVRGRKGRVSGSERREQEGTDKVV